MKNISIIGIGLIGGSFGLNLRALYKDALIQGIDQNDTHITEAIDLGLIDEKGDLESVSQSDLVVLSVPVNAALKLLPTVLDRLSPKALVMDMGSTKSSICEAVDGHPKRAQFLANHPIAGTEFSGPSAAHLSLFNNKTNIICDINNS